MIPNPALCNLSIFIAPGQPYPLELNSSERSLRLFSIRVGTLEDTRKDLSLARPLSTVYLSLNQKPVLEKPLVLKKFVLLLGTSGSFEAVLQK